MSSVARLACKPSKTDLVTNDFIYYGDKRMVVVFYLMKHS